MYILAPVRLELLVGDGSVSNLVQVTLHLGAVPRSQDEEHHVDCQENTHWSDEEDKHSLFSRYNVNTQIYICKYLSTLPSKMSYYTEKNRKSWSNYCK